MTKRFIPVLAACLFLMVGTAQAATSLCIPPRYQGGKPLMQTLSGRATNRSFTAKPLSDKLLGDLLWAAYGVNRPTENGPSPRPRIGRILNLVRPQRWSMALRRPGNTASNRLLLQPAQLPSSRQGLSAKPR